MLKKIKIAKFGAKYGGNEIVFSNCKNVELISLVEKNETYVKYYVQKIDTINE